MTPFVAQAHAQPFLLETGLGRRFCLYHAPVDTCRGAFLYLHPFAEEMNKTRRMASLQARALAAIGYGVLQIDLHGCGDSDGDFGDASWESWKQDVAAGCAWLGQQLAQPVGLWGLRLGALLALDYASTASHPLGALLLWQPVLSGSTYLTQFLRMRVASELLAEHDGERGGTKALRAALLAGDVLEVAGYALTPALAAGIEGAGAAELAVKGCPVYWLEMVAAPDRPLPAAAAAVAARWQQQGVDLLAMPVAGPSFWATQEITETPALIEMTLAILSAEPA
jgi:exosortase A-associated hydrolase 2